MPHRTTRQQVLSSGRSSVRQIKTIIRSSAEGTIQAAEFRGQTFTKRCPSVGRSYSTKNRSNERLILYRGNVHYRREDLTSSNSPIICRPYGRFEDGEGPGRLANGSMGMMRRLVPRIARALLVAARFMSPSACDLDARLRGRRFKRRHQYENCAG